MSRHDACKRVQNALQNVLEGLLDPKSLAILSTLLVFAAFVSAVIK